MRKMNKIFLGLQEGLLPFVKEQFDTALERIHHQPLRYNIGKSHFGRGNSRQGHR